MLIPGRMIISQNTTLQSENLEFTPAGYYFVNPGITLTIKSGCRIYAHLEQPLFDGPGKVICEIESRVSANWWLSDPSDFGKTLSKCYESAQQAALIEHFGNHKIKSSVNATQRETERQTHRHYGSYQFDTDSVVFDYSRRRNLVVEGLDVVGKGNKVAEVGILQSRDSLQSATNHCAFKNCRISGNFSIAALYNHSSNFSLYEGCHFLSVGAGAGVILTAKNEDGVESDYCELLGNNRITNICQTFDRCHFQGRGDKGGLWVDGLAGLLLSNCWVQATQCKAYYTVSNKRSGCGNIRIMGGMSDTADDLNKPEHFLYVDGKDCAQRSIINAHPNGNSFTTPIMIKKSVVDCLQDSLLQVNGIIST